MKIPAKITALIIASLVFTSNESIADIYKYVDEKGTTHFVDNLSKVPAQYRSKQDNPGNAVQNSGYAYKGENLLLFPYSEIENSAAKDGLWEDYFELPVQRAKPVIFKRSQSRIKVLGRHLIRYKADQENWQHQENERYGFNPDLIRKTEYTRDFEFPVVEVEVESSSFTEMRTGATVGFPLLRGYILEKRLNP